MYSMTFENVSMNWIVRENERIAVAADEVIIALEGEVRHVSRYVKQVFPDYKFQWSAKKTGRPKWYVYEPGVYQLIFSSPLAVIAPEKVERFQRWVFEDVLPSIRKEGGYISLTATPTQASALSDKLSKIITPNKRPWTLHFDKPWQAEACRLCKVTWKHPRMAQFINQTVYDFFPKEAIAKIKELNANGQQEHTAHHQYLTKSFDAIEYTQHLRDVYGYMLASPDLEVFWRLMEFRFKKTFQLDLFEDYLG